MEPADPAPVNTPFSAASPASQASLRLSLYVARSTPNSVRATSNLIAMLAALDMELAQPDLEIIDVFTEPSRAMKDGVIVTPTLIVICAGKRVILMGDLSNPAQLEGVIAGLLRG